MRAKPGSENSRAPADSKPREAGTRERIRADLERRGVLPSYSNAISSHLERVSEALSPKAYEAVLASVVLAHGGRRAEAEPSAARPHDLSELQRLMNGFAGELRKLDEALQILSAYVRRIRKSARVAGRDTLH